MVCQISCSTAVLLDFALCLRKVRCNAFRVSKSCGKEDSDSEQPRGAMLGSVSSPTATQGTDTAGKGSCGLWGARAASNKRSLGTRYLGRLRSWCPWQFLDKGLTSRCSTSGGRWALKGRLVVSRKGSDPAASTEAALQPPIPTWRSTAIYLHSLLGSCARHQPAEYPVPATPSARCPLGGAALPGPFCRSPAPLPLNNSSRRPPQPERPLPRRRLSALQPPTRRAPGADVTALPAGRPHPPPSATPPHRTPPCRRGCPSERLPNRGAPGSGSLPNRGAPALLLAPRRGVSHRRPALCPGRRRLQVAGRGRRRAGQPRLFGVLRGGDGRADRCLLHFALQCQRLQQRGLLTARPARAPGPAPPGPADFPR